MILRGIDFGNVLGASGVQGFFGEGYWFHKLPRPFRPDFTGMTLVGKTTTLELRQGAMALKEDFTPRDLFPDCITFKFWLAVMLNAVRLSGPGLKVLAETGKWQRLTNTFMLSVMSVAETPTLRLAEFRIFAKLLAHYKSQFKAQFGLQVNLSCPNTGHDPKELIGEAAKVLDILSFVDVPLMPKFSIASAPITAVMELQQHPACDAICVSNTVPYDYLGLGEKVWGKKKSPLAHYGGGGISGAVLRPLVCDWIKKLRDVGFTKPINGGGGIMSCVDVDHYRAAGASSIFLGSVVSQRPWRVQRIIRYANSLNWR